jgi:cytochrome c556
VNTTIATGAVLVLLAGCGGSSSSSSANFKPGYTSAMKALGTTASQIGTTIEGAANQTDSALESTFKSLASHWQTGTGQLDKLTAPSSVSSEFASLKGAASRVETDLNAIASAASSHSQTAAKTAAEHLVIDLAAGKTADQKIRTTLKLPAETSG